VERALMPTPPPGPRGEILGRLNYDFWRSDMFGFLATLAESYGDVAGFDLGGSSCILVNGASEVRELFFDREGCLRKPEFVKDSNRGHWGDGLTSLEGAAWRTRRRVLRPSFTARQVSARMPVVARCAADMLDRWAAGADLLRELRILTARVSARFVLDADVEGYSNAAGRSGALPLEEAYGEDYASIPGGDPTAMLIMTRPRAPRRMDTAIRIIDERIASGEDRGDVLSDLIERRLPDGGRLTRDDIVGEVIQLLYAGHLTIPYTLTSFWRDIAANDAAGRIATESELLCPTAVADSTVLSRSYCLAALKESMRLHPAAPILYREVEIPFELGGFEFARDVAVWVSPRLLHVDPRYFPEPHRFLPERFMKGGLAPTSGSVYLPFGAGPRACIGSHMAAHEMTLIALLAARRFTPEWISERLVRDTGGRGITT
jgi:cytochrome P450